MLKNPLKYLPAFAIAGMLSAQLAVAGGMGGGGPTTPISFTGLADVSFGMINVTVGTGNIDMGTNGSIAYGAGYSGSGLGTAGQFSINGSQNFNVNISCSATATLANGVGNTMPISVIEIINETGAAFGAGTDCAGLGNTIIVHRLHPNAGKNVFFVGMRINGTGGVPGGPGFFSTSNAGGSPVTIDVVYV